MLEIVFPCEHDRSIFVSVQVNLTMCACDMTASSGQHRGQSYFVGGYLRSQVICHAENPTSVRWTENAPEPAISSPMLGLLVSVQVTDSIDPLRAAHSGTEDVYFHSCRPGDRAWYCHGVLLYRTMERFVY